MLHIQARRAGTVVAVILFTIALSAAWLLTT